MLQLIICHSVKHKDNTRWLEILLNRKLNWSEHISQKVLNAKHIILPIKRYVRLNWGIEGKILTNLNKSLVEPILLYGSAIWIGATYQKWCITKLRNVQTYGYDNNLSIPYSFNKCCTINFSSPAH